MYKVLRQNNVSMYYTTPYATFEARFSKRLLNTDAELEKDVAYKKEVLLETTRNENQRNSIVNISKQSKIRAAKLNIISRYQKTF